MPSKQDTVRIGEWKAKNIDRIVIEVRKEERFPDRLKAAVESGLAASRQAYIIDAVRQSLQDDGM